MLLEKLDAFNDALWLIPLVLIVATGLYFTFRFKGTQVADFKESIGVTFGRSEYHKTGVSSLKVFFISLGSRVGIGNITGPVLAILIGGPGAIFWMWVFSALGMATSLAEVTLGQIYKKRMTGGTFRGGTAYVARHGLGLVRTSKFITAFLILTYVVGGVSLCSSGAASAFKTTIPVENVELWTAIAFTALTAAVVFGGVSRVANFALRAVPAAILLWFVVAISSIVISGGPLNGFELIFTYAFSPPAAIGGGIGSMLLIGMQRGVLSNEAGVGTITNVSSMADVNHPVRQGLSQSLGVLLDTIVCTITALVVLSYVDVPLLVSTELESMELLLGILEGTLGPVVPIMISICVFIFGFTTIISDYIIGEGNIAMLMKWEHSRYIIVAIILPVVFFSALFASDAMFVIVDIFYAFCAMINVTLVLILSNRAVEAYRDYKEQRRRGIKDPIFTKDTISDSSGVTEWD